jgi:sigma-E factor negative regulatory protein RseB
LIPALAFGADDPRAWLERMSYAVEYLNYEGRLIHVLGGETSTLNIAHRVEDGRVTERITSDDAGREIIRNDDGTTCIFPDRRTVLVEEGDESDESESALRRRLPVTSTINDAFYSLAFAGTERIAGRNCQILAIRPKDAFRYGYRLSLDRATGMPLKTQLVDEEGRMLEQILFSEITLPKHIPGSAVQPAVTFDSFAVRRSGSSAAAKGVRKPGEWGSAEIPPGFRLTVPLARVAPDARSGLRHLVYSDGLATVSLFIEPAVAASEQAEGLSQIGAANAYTTTIAGHMITAVGEVPARTVEIFALSARPASSPSKSQ